MDQLMALYAAIDAQDADALAARLARHVDWPEPITGGRVVGREAVREHWVAQWAQLQVSLHPRLVRDRVDGRVEVLLDQVVRDADVDLLSESVVRHVVTLEEGLVARLDVEDPQV